MDATASFPLTGPAALGPGGVLVWPKLFRRAIDYLRQHAAGQSLPDCLAATPSEDDGIHLLTNGSGGDGGEGSGSGGGGAVGGDGAVALHTLLTQTGQQVYLDADLLDLVVAER